MKMNLLIKVVFSGLFFLSLFPWVEGQSTTLIPFSLEDQFDKTYTDKEYQRYYVIVVGGDRKGSDYCFPWSDAIKEELKAKQNIEIVKVLGIACGQSPSSFLGDKGAGWLNHRQRPRIEIRSGPSPLSPSRGEGEV